MTGYFTIDTPNDIRDLKRLSLSLNTPLIESDLVILLDSIIYKVSSSYIEQLSIEEQVTRIASELILKKIIIHANDNEVSYLLILIRNLLLNLYNQDSVYNFVTSDNVIRVDDNKIIIART